MADEFCRLIREEGLTRAAAAGIVGVDPATVSRAYSRGAGEDRGFFRDFYLAVNAAEAGLERRGVGMIFAAASSNPKLVQWFLSRRFPAAFGRRDNVEPVEPEDRAAQLASTRALLLERLERLAGQEFPEPAPSTPAEPEESKS